MGSDFFFRMGSTHAVCQDYSLAGERGWLSYALLSDGCSGRPIADEPGSPFTDFGARFLVRAAHRYISEMVTGTFPATAIVHDALAIVHQARLPIVALDATLLVAATTESGDLRTFQTGDGVIAWKNRDGSMGYETLEFGNGMPYYLSYLAQPQRKKSFFYPPPEERVLSPELAGHVTVTTGMRLPGGPWQQSQAEHRLDETSIERAKVFSCSEVELVLLLSDGAESFQLKDGTAIPLEQVLEQLFEIKGFTGQFLTRRCTRFLQKFCAEHGWQHADDFSVAGIYVKKP